MIVPPHSDGEGAWVFSESSPAERGIFLDFCIENGYESVCTSVGLKEGAKLHELMIRILKGIMNAR